MEEIRRAAREAAREAARVAEESEGGASGSSAAIRFPSSAPALSQEDVDRRQARDLFKPSTPKAEPVMNLF